MIQVDGLSKYFGKHQVLNEVHAKFDHGKIYGIVGKNGAGKTTLFRCIAGLETYEGLIQASFSPLKNNLSLLLTEPYFLKFITGAEYLRLIANASGKTFHDAQQNIFDLPLNAYASTYSTGMKKKLAITGVLLQERPYVLLDEPFNGLDIQSNMLLQEIIQQLKRLNKVVLVSSHIFSSLNEICDSIFYIDKCQPLVEYPKADFQFLETQMRQSTVGDKIREMNLR